MLIIALGWDVPDGLMAMTALRRYDTSFWPGVSSQQTASPQISQEQQEACEQLQNMPAEQLLYIKHQLAAMLSTEAVAAAQ